MGLEIFMAWRFIKEAKTQTILILLAIMIGVGVQVFVSALITGLQANLLSKTVGDSPHLVISSRELVPTSLIRENLPAGTLLINTSSWVKKDQDLTNWQPIVDSLREEPAIKTVSPLVSGSGFLQKGETKRSVIIKGVQPAAAEQIYKYEQKIMQGRPQISGNDILLGMELAKDLNLGVGDSLQINTSLGNEAFFTVKGIFEFGNSGIDSSWVLMDLARAQSLLQKGGNISTIEVQIRDVFASEELAAKLQKRWVTISTATWQTSNKQLLSGLKSQASSSYIIQFFVQVAILLGISSVLAISVVQKAKLIGILKAMGLRNNRISRIFLLQGGFLGLIGSVFGFGIGVILVRIFMYFTSKSAADASFPINTTLSSFLFSVSIATLASIVAAFIPARRAASFNPIEVIRNG